MHRNITKLCPTNLHGEMTNEILVKHGGSLSCNSCNVRFFLNVILEQCNWQEKPASSLRSLGIGGGGGVQRGHTSKSLDELKAYVKYV